MDITAALISQHLASLKMMEQAIIDCPESEWDNPADENRSWQIAFHAIYFVHEYLADDFKSFTPWPRHRPGYEEFDFPEDAEAYDKETLLEYLAFCRDHVVERLPRMDLAGYYDPEYTRLERQINSIRHVMGHIGELGERIGARGGRGLDWVGHMHE